MMNVVGNPTGLPKVFNAQDANKQTVMLITLAVDRDFKSKDGTYGVDYIQFKAFPRSNAEGSFIWNTVENSLGNKRKIAIKASRQQNIYDDKNNEKVYEEINRVDNINLTGSLNSIELTGRLSRDAQFFSKNVVIVSLAVNRNYVAKGESQPKVDYIQAKIFTRSENQKNTFEKHLKQGELISVQGNVQSSKYTDKNGQVQYSEEVIVDNVNMFLAKSPNKQDAPAQNESPAHSAPSTNPFA